MRVCLLNIFSSIFTTLRTWHFEEDLLDLLKVLFNFLHLNRSLQRKHWFSPAAFFNKLCKYKFIYVSGKSASLATSQDHCGTHPVQRTNSLHLTNFADYSRSADVTLHQSTSILTLNRRKSDWMPIILSQTQHENGDLQENHSHSWNRWVWIILNTILPIIKSFKFSHNSI